MLCMNIWRHCSTFHITCAIGDSCQFDTLFSPLPAPPVADPMERTTHLPSSIHTTAMAAPAPWEHTPQDVNIPPLFSEEAQPRKKKYAKEAWPGKKPPQHLLV